jgi:hypothetical protein
MRLAILALAIVFAITACAAANPASLTNVLQPKQSVPVTPPPSKGPMQGGDTIASATLIAALPYDDTGTTVGYTNDYDEACPYTGSISPDVVYVYTPTATELLDIYTCDSGYDTKVFVYENAYTPSAPYACNDDDYDWCAVSNYRSWINDMWAFAGNTYYIVVDGYGGASGAYEFHVRSVAPPQVCDPLFCPPGAIVNGEPTCYDGYADTYNGGCNDVTTPYSFEAFALNTTVCGESGNYTDNSQRDMDWFHFTPTSNVTVNFCLCSDFAGRIWIGTIDCATGVNVLQSTATTPGYLGCLTQALTAGTQYTLIVSTDGWLSIPCGAKYVASLYEEGFTPVQPTTWGTLKALYR